MAVDSEIRGMIRLRTPVAEDTSIEFQAKKSIWQHWFFKVSMIRQSEHFVSLNEICVVISNRNNRWKKGKQKPAFLSQAFSLGGTRSKSWYTEDLIDNWPINPIIIKILASRKRSLHALCEGSSRPFFRLDRSGREGTGLYAHFCLSPSNESTCLVPGYVYHISLTTDS